MSEIDELQNRLTAALDRIAAGLEQGLAGGGGAEPAELERLREELEDERLVGEQLRERLKVIRKRRERLEAELEAARKAAIEAVSRIDGELQSLRETNAQLREINTRLREANAAGLADPDLVNAALEAELKALRATHAADRAEAEAIYAELSAALDAAQQAQTEPQTEPQTEEA